jgi:hypothetical protein
MYPCDTVKSAMQIMHDEAPAVASSSSGGGSSGSLATAARAMPGAAPALQPPAAAVPVARSSPPSFMAILGQMYQRGGLRGLYSGFFPTVIRAAPSNAAIFVVYEWSAKLLKEQTGWASDDGR